MDILTALDLDGLADIESAKADKMIADATAQATMVAPCLAHPEQLTELQVSAARAILRRAVLRWHEAGVAATITQETTGPFSRTVSTVQRGGLFQPAEITDLQAICKSSQESSTRAFGVDQIGGVAAGHLPWCSITWGAWCSCGANLTRGEYPLYEGGLLS